MMLIGWLILVGAALVGVFFGIRKLGNDMLKSDIKIQLKELATNKFIVRLMNGKTELMCSRVFLDKSDALRLIDKLIEGCEWEVIQ